MSSTFFRYFPGACLATTFLLAATLFMFGDTHAYHAILWQLGVDPFTFPFLDTHGVLSTGECHRYGVDVLAENPCDVLGRTLDYSPFWLITSKLGLNTGLTTEVGLALDILFLFWVFFLPPAHNWPQAIVLTLAMLSSMVGLALERANLDLAIFVIGIVAANWSLRGAPWRMLSYGLIMLGGLIKYYPTVMLIVAIRERLVWLLAVAVAMMAAIALLVVHEAADLGRAISQIEESGGWFTSAFGARNLPNGLIEMMSSRFNASPASLQLIFILAAILGAITIATVEDLEQSLKYLPTYSRTLLLIGSILIVACFFTALNAQYRGIYFLFVLPGITALWRAPISEAARQRFTLAGLCILFLMWSECIMRGLGNILDLLGLGPRLAVGTHFALWILREVTWWWVVTVLLALLITLVHRSRSGQEILRRVLRVEPEGAAPAAPFGAATIAKDPPRA